jgi:hypothetical protein
LIGIQKHIAAEVSERRRRRIFVTADTAQPAAFLLAWLRQQADRDRHGHHLESLGGLHDAELHARDLLRIHVAHANEAVHFVHCYREANFTEDRQLVRDRLRQLVQPIDVIAPEAVDYFLHRRIVRSRLETFADGVSRQDLDNALSERRRYREVVAHLLHAQLHQRVQVADRALLSDAAIERVARISGVQREQRGPHGFPCEHGLFVLRCLACGLRLASRLGRARFGQLKWFYAHITLLLRSRCISSSGWSSSLSPPGCCTATADIIPRDWR